MAINPLLYNDQSENEVLSQPGAEVIQAPKQGFIAGAFNTFGTEAGNIPVSLWNVVKEQARFQLSGQEDLLKETGGDRWLEPTKIREVDPATTSAASQIVGGLGADAIKIAMGPVGWFTAGEIERQRTKQQLVAQGIDANTAELAATEKGIETAATFGIARIPFASRIAAIGSRALRWGARAGVGVGTVTGMDFIGGESRSAILEANGYTRQAAQMRHWDGMRVASDIFGGAMLGLTTQAPMLGGRILSDEEALAGRHIQDADDLFHESGPGIPTDGQTSAASTNATLKAMQDITNGDPVNVADVGGVFDAHFLAKVENDVKTARADVTDHEKYLADVSKSRDETADFIERARRDGYHEEADHYAENVLPGRQAVVQQYERLLDEARDRLHAAENPEALSRPAEQIRTQLEDHSDSQAVMATKMDELTQPRVDTSPAAKTQPSETQRDYVAEARQMIADVKNPVANAIEQRSVAPTGQPTTRLTPEQQELVNMHAELRQLADATGDTELHADLDEAMRLHSKEHAEAGKFNVAALCAIGY